MCIGLDEIISVDGRVFPEKNEVCLREQSFVKKRIVKQEIGGLIIVRPEKRVWGFEKADQKIILT